MNKGVFESLWWVNGVILRLGVRLRGKIGRKSVLNRSVSGGCTCLFCDFKKIFVFLGLSGILVGILDTFVGLKDFTVVFMCKVLYEENGI